MKIVKMIGGALVLVAVVVGILLLFFGDWAMNMIEGTSSMQMPDKQPLSVYELNAQGTDLRVYEFIPNAGSNVICMIVAGTNKMTSACFPKSQ